jgi:hypothetical protein
VEEADGVAGVEEAGGQNRRAWPKTGGWCGAGSGGGVQAGVGVRARWVTAGVVGSGIESE